MYDVAIIGGGLAGLINAILLSRHGLSVILFEKNEYPFHRVCGEYISNEVKEFLIRNDIFPDEYGPADISQFTLTSVSGRASRVKLDLGGFGISRYSFDQFLLGKAKSSGTEIRDKCKVHDLQFLSNSFTIGTDSGDYESKLVIGAHGKRSTLDSRLHRPFMSKRSPYIGVKYHIKTDFPDNEIALHNFKDGYCGISKVEGDTFNLCYLSHRDNLKMSGDIESMESQILSQNPFLDRIWQNSDFLFAKPMVINEISFEKKSPVENHVFMSGDSAGMITPLCGNGMAMAIRSAYLLSTTISQNSKNASFDRLDLEKQYQYQWNKEFSARLWVGRQIQRLFGSNVLSEIAVGAIRNKPIAHRIIGATHGENF